MNERVLDALHDMLDHARKARDLIGDQDVEAFLGDERNRLAAERLLEIIGEAATRIPDHDRDQIDLPWKRIVGLRNRLIHAYHHTDPATLVDILEDHLPGFIQTLEVYLAAHPD